MQSDWFSVVRFIYTSKHALKNILKKFYFESTFHLHEHKTFDNMLAKADWQTKHTPKATLLQLA